MADWSEVFSDWLVKFSCLAVVTVCEKMIL